MTTQTSKRDRRPSTRARRLRAHPLCAECLKAGVTKATEEIDHVIPLDHAHLHPDRDLESDDNVQGLCTYHNRMKRNRESYGHVTYGLDGWPTDEGGGASKV